MKLILLLLSALATAAATKASLRTTDDMIVTVQETHFTFEVKSEAEPVRSAAVDDMVTSCLATSFNEIHDPTEYHVESIEVESEDVAPVSIHGVESGAGFPLFFWRFWAFLTSDRCRFCSPELSSTHNYPDWENAFCTCLQGSSDETLATAFQCHIERPDIAAINTKVA